MYHGLDRADLRDVKTIAVKSDSGDTTVFFAGRIRLVVCKTIVTITTFKARIPGSLTRFTPSEKRLVRAIEAN